MGCVTSLVSTFFGSRLSEKELRRYDPTHNAHFKEAVELNKSVLESTRAQLDKAVVQVEMLEAKVEGVRRRCQQLKKSGRPYTGQKRQLALELQRLSAARDVETKLVARVSECLRNESYFASSESEATILQQNLQLSKQMQLSGMDATMMMKLTTRSKEIESQIAVNSSIMNEKQRAMASVNRREALNDTGVEVDDDLEKLIDGDIERNTVREDRVAEAEQFADSVHHVLEESEAASDVEISTGTIQVKVDSLYQ